MFNLKMVLVLVLFVGGVMSVQAQANSNETIVEGSNFADKQAWLQAFAQSNGNYIIEVKADESIPSQNLEYKGKNNITITLRATTGKRTIILLSDNSFFAVGAGITLVMDKNITLQGLGRGENALVYIRQGGTFRMSNDSMIKYIGSKGVSVDGTFDMNGGNIATSYGTGVVVNGSFNMSGGTISGSKKGVSVENGTFTMTGGTITKNSENGVYINEGGAFTMNNGTISATSGDGVATWGRFIMSGGKITGNKKGVAVLAALYQAAGVFTMNDGTISDNSEGGVNVGSFIYMGGKELCIFNMKGGTISGNKSPWDGAGVYVWGTFNMSGGTISGNTATGSGGGVYVRGRGTFNMSGGTISSNTALISGGGVFVSNNFKKTGGSISGFTTSSNNSNAVKNGTGAVQNYKGHAVYAVTNGLVKIKESTAGSGDNLTFNSESEKFDGAWDN